ncbi:hypothetical protein H8L32_21595 [Undibacterium sp. CY18W]|uniref:Uncharacterized protein n=1 Tax=Undibacterium hunanense TaxID=2762292 RepID=A0ABR6ZW29_9BURK|nr:hypothetical protein [Undibacterium hunanense]MBC3920076.1 hypothetical protein [Undibacterium hunanense]
MAEKINYSLEDQYRVVPDKLCLNNLLRVRHDFEMFIEISTLKVRAITRGYLHLHEYQPEIAAHQIEVYSLRLS